MRDESVANFYNIYDAIFPTANTFDLTDGIYEKPETTYEQAQLNQSNWLLDQIGCKPDSAILDIGCGYGTLLEQAQKRNATAKGISISEKQVEFCLKKGFDVFLLNYKDIDHQWHSKFDGIIANGSLEHFVKPEEADRADQIYRNFFRICHQLINPKSPNRRLATTAIHFNHFSPRHPLDMTKNPFSFPFLSHDFHAAVIQKAMGCFPPSTDQLEKCGRPLFKLIKEVDGTDDYRRTSEEWLRRGRKSCLNPIKLLKMILLLTPFLAKHPIHTITSISFLLIESWNVQFRGQNSPTKLLRQIWEHQ